MKIELDILLSCMNQEDFSIVEQSNIKSNCIIVNQCDHEEVKCYKSNVTMYCVKDKGLSKSRNLAIKNSNADICVISDDDEFFFEDMEQIVKSAYERYNDADIIIFEIENIRKDISNIEKKMNFFELFKVSSVQITFRRDSINKHQIKFDPLLGAGSGNGAGEENKFLIDCYRKGLNIYYVPISIGYLRTENKSTWFNGYNREYFYYRGKATAYYLGRYLAILYAFYFILTKYSIYKKDTTMLNAMIGIFKGIFSKKIGEYNE